MATLPDLPTPITPDDAPGYTPGHMPVEPDEGPLTPPGPPAELERSFVSERAAAHFSANRHFMRAAAFRWPTFRTVAFAPAR